MEKKKRMMRETVVSFMAMVLMEGCTIALTITVKSAMEKGMNQFVFVAYSNALSSLILLPYSYFFHKDRKFGSMKEMFSIKLVIRFFLLGFTGISMAQNLAFTGLRYSSPIVVCSMGLLLPSFQFFLALLLRKTKVDLRRTSGKIRIVGSSVSLIGAVVVATYKGRSILEEALIKPRLLHSVDDHPLFVFVSTTNSERWLFGCLLLATATFFLALWSILQASTFKKLPDMMMIVTWYVTFGTIQTVVVDVLAERDFSAWKFRFNLELLIIILTAVFGTFVRSKVQAWCMRSKGVVYVSLFKPFGIFWACAISLSFFGSTLHIGSVMGAGVAGIGYYTMLWGSVKEEEEKRIDELAREFVNDDDDQLKVPLLIKEEDIV